MPHTTSVDLDAMEGAPSSARYLDDNNFQPLHSAASISHAYGLPDSISSPASQAPRSDLVASTSSSDYLAYDQDLPWPLHYLSEHPSSKHYDAHFFSSSTLPRLGRFGSKGSFSANGNVFGSSSGDPSHVGSLVVTIFHSFGQHLQWAKRGIQDANRWGDAWRLISSSPEVRTGVIKGLILSASISLLVFFFELAFLPDQLFRVGKEFQENPDDISHWFNTFFLYPLIGGSYLLAASWTTEVAQAAYAIQRRKAKKGDEHRMSALAQGISEFSPSAAHTSIQSMDAAATVASSAINSVSVASIASQAYRLLLVANYTLLGVAISKFTSMFLPGYLRYIGVAAEFCLMSWVDAYYCFELLYIAKGWGFEKRARYTEMRFFYYAAFGVPSTLVSYFHPSGLLNLMLFMLVFPFCSVLALLADPQPHDTAVLKTLIPGRFCILFPTVRIHRWLVKNVVRSRIGKQNLFSSSYAGNGNQAAAALGNGIQSAFRMGKTSSAARVVGQIWNEATQKKGDYRPQNRYGAGVNGGYGGYRPQPPNGYAQGYGYAGAAAQPTGFTSAAAPMPGGAAAGYATYPTSPLAPAKMASAPPPKGAARRMKMTMDASSPAGKGTMGPGPRAVPTALGAANGTSIAGDYAYVQDKASKPGAQAQGASSINGLDAAQDPSASPEAPGPSSSRPVSSKVGAKGKKSD